MELALNLQVLSNQNMMYGYNAAKNQYEDLMLAGIIDPTKVKHTDLKVNSL